MLKKTASSINKTTGSDFRDDLLLRLLNKVESIDDRSRALSNDMKEIAQALKGTVSNQENMIVINRELVGLLNAAVDAINSNSSGVEDLEGQLAQLEESIDESLFKFSLNLRRGEPKS